ncbi:hypothetical protein Bint_1253 [Brachyspira intermedia PWS/A]|uniref:Secreted protein n=1 Tax=Brachyspira intermedia (strain ATCC 51140 / PWS/A) TaxID=1045858 RepID=G0ENJ3_BRAIP|nr:hypothetical protein Bint_1253 [Brachyspira intermedia PWS/A]
MNYRGGFFSLLLLLCSPTFKVPNWFAYNKQINKFICTNVASAHFIITMLKKVYKLINNKLLNKLFSLSNYY